MSECKEIIAIVEGSTEQRFIKQVLAPYLTNSNVYLTPIILDKPGEKGGDVKFARAQNDIEKHIKQRRDTWVTMFVDYYGIRADWPGYQDSKKQITHIRKAAVMNKATASEIARLFPTENTVKRFIPYVSMHEIEALYFSDPTILAAKLDVSVKRINSILKECGEPEKVNDSSQTAPSKRLTALSDRFKKTSTGVSIASEIGIPKMRVACPIFNEWLTTLENL